MKKEYTQLEGKVIKSILTNDIEDDYELLILFTDGKSLRVLIEWEEDSNITIETTYKLKNE